jgi:hypothetical protein
MCLQYTEVYRTMRWEMAISMFVGLLIGMAAVWAVWLEKRR